MTKKLLMNKIGGNSESIPYEILEYIEGTGTQYINTEVIPTLKTKIEIDMLFSKYINSYSYFFGCDSFFKANFTNDRYYFNIYKYDSRITDISTSFLLETKCKYIIDMSDTSKYMQIMNDNSEILDYDFSGSISVNSSQKPFHIFNAYTGYDELDNYYISKGRLYSCKIWENGALIRDFIPVLDNDNTPCLYDSINNKCHYNVGTGSFEYPQ